MHNYYYAWTAQDSDVYQIDWGDELSPCSWRSGPPGASVPAWTGSGPGHSIRTPLLLLAVPTPRKLTTAILGYLERFNRPFLPAFESTDAGKGRVLNENQNPSFQTALRMHRPGIKNKKLIGVLTRIRPGPNGKTYRKTEIEIWRKIYYQ